MKCSSNRIKTKSVGIKFDAYEGRVRTIHSNHLIFFLGYFAEGALALLCWRITLFSVYQSATLLT